jgi:hypothetical protein
MAFLFAGKMLFSFMKVNPINKVKMGTEFKKGTAVLKVSNDYTNGRRGIVLDVNVNTGKSKVYWHKQHIIKWCSWCSLELHGSEPLGLSRVRNSDNID